MSDLKFSIFENMALKKAGSEIFGKIPEIRTRSGQLKNSVL